MASSPMVIRLSRPRTRIAGTSGFQERLLYRLRIWLPVVAFAMVLAVESTSYFGGDRTSEPLLRIAEAIFGYGVGLHWELIHFLIRKTGHFTGYGGFCLICVRSFRIELQCAASRVSKQWRALGLAILVTFLVASADEFHQSFLPNRTGQLSDVMLDTCGGTVLGLALFMSTKIIEERRLARQQADCRPNSASARAAA